MPSYVRPGIRKCAKNRALSARRLGVRGWVRNCRDGSVELEAQGSSDAVQALVEQLAIGPRWSEVSHVAVHDMPIIDETARAFGVRQ